MQVIKEYINNNGGSILFSEYATSNELKSASRKKLVSYLVDYLLACHGEGVPKSAKVAVAKAAVRLFPSFYIEDSCVGGIVSVII